MHSVEYIIIIAQSCVCLVYVGLKMLLLADVVAIIHILVPPEEWKLNTTSEQRIIIGW